MFKHILLPTDGSQGVTKAINVAVGMALEFQAGIQILTVIEPPSMTLAYSGIGGLAEREILDRLLEEAKQIVEKTKRRIQDAGLEDVEGRVEEGHPAETILQYAQTHKSDLIVMGTHGRRGLNRMILGSVAEEIVRRSPVPVMTVRMAENEELKKR
jgi:nucleotide-binding universal stress UspA family protein